MNDDDRRFGMTTLRQVADVPQRLYYKWRDLFRPATGDGQWVAWSADEVVAFALIKRLRMYGVPLDDAYGLAVRHAARSDRLTYSMTPGTELAVDVRFFRRGVYAALAQYEPVDAESGRHVAADPATERVSAGGQRGATV